MRGGLSGAGAAAEIERSQAGAELASAKISLRVMIPLNSEKSPEEGETPDGVSP